MTAIRPSTREIRPLAATFGQRMSANAHACWYQVTDDTSRTIESGRPVSTSKASPLSAARPRSGDMTPYLVSDRMCLAGLTL